MVIAAFFWPNAHDPTLFVYLSTRTQTLLLLYVDDMIIIGDDSEYIAFVKARLSEQFLMSDLGPLCYFLGIDVSCTSLMASIFPRKIISMVSLIVLPLIMSALLRLLWRLMSTSMLLMFTPYLIFIVILLGILSI
jgi:hypothetical protein